MKHFILRLLEMIMGLAFFSLGIVFTIMANIGYAPWDVFHYGLVNTMGISFGLSSILVGFIIMAVLFILKEKAGIGTLCNMVLIGIFIDLIMYSGIIPLQENLIFGILFLIIGMILISVGTYFYIRTGFGIGPRDNLMVVLTRVARVPVGICRSAVELLVTAAGWLLGGMVGIGTVVLVIGIGFFIQLTFRLFRFDITAVKHESVLETINSLRRPGDHKNGD